MWTRILLIGSLLIGGGWVASPPAQAGCLVDTGTYTTGTVLREPLCDTNGNLKVTGSATSSNGVATAAAPSYVEGTANPGSMDLAGNQRVTLGTLLSGEDQTNNLMMTSGGAVRQTIVASAVGTDTTSTAAIIPVGSKTIYGQVVCSSGACTQTQKIYGDIDSDAANGVLLCTLTLSGTTRTQDACPVITANFSYYYVVTTATTGTAAAGAVYAMY
jgi:hypothetical protein